MNRRALRERMRAWIELGQREGLSMGELAERSGVALRTLYRWSSRLGREARASSSERPQEFAQLVRRAEPSGAVFELVLNGDRRLRVPSGFDERELARLIAALERAC